MTVALVSAAAAGRASAQSGTVSLDAVPVATAEDSDSLVVAAEDPDALVTTEAADPAPAAPAPSAKPAALAEAQRRLDDANAAYSNMIARDYPRGDARAAIISERDAARDAYERARTASDAD